MRACALYTADNHLTALVDKKAARYGLNVLSQADISAHSYDFILEYLTAPEQPGYFTQLCSTNPDISGAISIDFTAGKHAHRRQFGGGRQQPLARAAGLKPGINPHILDLTAGLGRDAFVLASLGCELSLVERNPIVYELLENALERAQYHEATANIVKRICLIFDNAANYLLSLDGNSYPDTIYIDPMYPQRSKSAQVKKEMQFFHQIVGQDDDASKLLDAALKSPVKRIVVKRPKSANTLGDFKAVSHISSKNTRYDIYTGKG